MKTQPELKEAIKNEVSRITAAIAPNEYGDWTRMPDDCDKNGIRGHGVRATEVLWWKKGRPVKRTVWVTSAALETLYGELAALDAAAKKAAKQAEREAQKAADKTSATAAGFKSVAAWKRSEKERIQREEEQAADIRRARNTERLEAVGLAASATEFVCVLGVLEEAKRDGFEVEHEHARAALYARRNNSSSWQAYNEGELSASQFLHRSERAQDRHENTNYDQLLRAGWDRELARECREQY